MKFQKVEILQKIHLSYTCKGCFFQYIIIHGVEYRPKLPPSITIHSRAMSKKYNYCLISLSMFHMQSMLEKDSPHIRACLIYYNV